MSGILFYLFVVGGIISACTVAFGSTPARTTSAIIATAFFSGLALIASSASIIGIALTVIAVALWFRARRARRGEPKEFDGAEVEVNGTEPQASDGRMLAAVALASGFCAALLVVIWGNPFWERGAGVVPSQKAISAGDFVLPVVILFVMLAAFVALRGALQADDGVKDYGKDTRTAGAK